MTAVLLHDASATLDGNHWANNAVDVRQQHCSAGTAILAATDLADVPNWEQSCPIGADQLIDLSFDFSSLYLPESAPEE